MCLFEVEPEKMHTTPPHFLLSALSYFYSLYIWRCTITRPLLPLSLQNCGHQGKQRGNDKRDGREEKKHWKLQIAVATPQTVAAKFLVGKDFTSLNYRYAAEMGRKSTIFLPVPAILSQGSVFTFTHRKSSWGLACFNLYF